MFRLSKWLIVLCAIGVTVLIAAVKQDDCDPGDRPPAPNSRAESGAVPRAFMDRPALAEMLRNVPVHLRTRGEIFGNLYHEQYYGSLVYDRRTKVDVDCCAVHNGNVSSITCLEDVAQALADFRAAADESTNNR